MTLGAEPRAIHFEGGAQVLEHLCLHPGFPVIMYILYAYFYIYIYIYVCMYIDTHTHICMQKQADVPGEIGRETQGERERERESKCEKD